MRKGDEKRQELLDAAERLFCGQGYEQTSIQDILNLLHLSKGGFYHHFASKEEVLRALCERRAERAAAYTAERLNDARNPMARINAVLHGFIPLRREEAGFAAMLLPSIGKPEGRAVATIYQDRLAETFLPMLKAEIAAAGAVQIICPAVREMENVILHVVNHCWMETLAFMAEACGKNQRPNQLELLNMLEKYRRAVEVLLDAPYGSIEIIRIEEWDEVAAMIRQAMPVS